MVMRKDIKTSLPLPEKPVVNDIIQFGVWVLVSFFGIFILWSCFTTIESAAIAPGKVMVESSRKSIQHLEGGIVKQIYVKEGDAVKKGAIAD